MTTGTLEAGDRAAAQAQKTPFRVTLDHIKSKIETVEFHRPEVAQHMTVAFVKLRNGYVVIGKSAPADPANFNETLGRDFATEDAIRQIWSLEGYALCERMALLRAVAENEG